MSRFHKKAEVTFLLLSMVFLLACIVTLITTGCSKKAESEPVVPVVEHVTDELPAEPPKPQYTNPLTGLPTEENIRKVHPVAVMINNLRAALPQAGISQAGIIYECMTEGSITRMLAVFNDYKDIEKIGAVRSARHYFIDLAGNHGAYYIHYGGSPQAYERIKKNKIKDLDGLSGLDGVMFYRDKERLKKGKYMLEHSAFTTGGKITKGLEYKKYDYELSEELPDQFLFSDEDYTPNGQTASKVTIPYGSYVTPYYTYDDSQKVYRRFEYGNKQIDSNSGEQIAFKNLLVLYVPQKNISGDTYGRIDITVTGSGKGIYCTNGVWIPIKFSKDSMNSPAKYYTEDGKELTINRGNTFINLLSNKLKAKIEA